MISAALSLLLATVPPTSQPGLPGNRAVIQVEIAPDAPEAGRALPEPAAPPQGRLPSLQAPALSDYDPVPDPQTPEDPDLSSCRPGTAPVRRR